MIDGAGLLALMGDQRVAVVEEEQMELLDLVLGQIGEAIIQQLLPVADDRALDQLLPRSSARRRRARS